MTLAAGNTFTITYGDTGSGGPGATATSSTGAQTWQAQEKSTSAGSLTNLGASPSITVNAADGSGTLTTPTTNVSASQTGRTITFTYTAPTGGISNGSVTLVVPAGWSAPSTTGSNAGYTTASSGTVSVASQTITVSSLTLAAGNTFTITYGDTGSGGPGATATSSTGAQTWQAQEKSTSTGSLTNLGASPSITVYAADGSGTLTTPTTNVAAGQTGRTITFTYTAATGGINNGSVTLVVPAGWSAPSTTGANAGYSTSSAGTLAVAGQTITVSSLTLAAGNTFTIVYGSTGGGGPGATATSSTGAQTWQAQEKSTSAGSLANLGASPSITVYAADGSGTLTTPTTSVPFASTGNTLTFTYTAATGGISNGSVTLVVPAGWNAPSTTGSSGGYTTASAGTVSVASQTITVSSLTLAGGSTFTITYGNTGSGGAGATAPSSSGAQTWQVQEKSTSASSLANLGSSPSVTVLAADGSGTLTTPTGSVNSAATGRTITFTYTAATGGISNGSVTAVVPAGWSAPSTTGSNAGYTTSSSGTVSVAGQTITVSSLTLVRGKHVHDHVRGHRFRRTGCHCPGSRGSADLAGAGEVELQRDAHESRGVAEHHRQRPDSAFGPRTQLRFVHERERNRHDGVHPPGDRGRLHRDGNLERHRIGDRPPHLRERSRDGLDRRRRRLELSVRGCIHLQLVCNGSGRKPRTSPRPTAGR